MQHAAAYSKILPHTCPTQINMHACSTDSTLWTERIPLWVQVPSTVSPVPLPWVCSATKLQMVQFKPVLSDEQYDLDEGLWLQRTAAGTLSLSKFLSVLMKFGSVRTCIGKKVKKVCG